MQVMLHFAIICGEPIGTVLVTELHGRAKLEDLREYKI